MSGSISRGRPAVSRSIMSRLFVRTLLGTTVLIGISTAQQASAQSRVVGACSGVQLRPSAVTGILSPVLTGITGPIENRVNSILGLPLISALLPGNPTLNTDLTNLLNDAANGQPITLQALASDGTLVGPTDECRVTADALTLDTPAGISIGGNQIVGLGANGTPSFASDINAIAFGNNARAEAGATGSIAIGANSQVTAANSIALGAGSLAGRGALGGYTAVGLTGTQASAGEVSVGSPTALRQITNLAAGSAPTDAATVGQVAGVAANAVNYTDPTRARATLAGTAGTVIDNLAPGALAATSTEAVNGSQLFATNTQVGTNTTAIVNTQTSITALQGQAANAVRYDTDAGGTRTGRVTLAGATPGQAVTLDNVAPGALSATSAEAVNGSQLFATNTQVGTNTTAIAGIDTRVTTNTQDIATLQGQTANAVRYDVDAGGVRTGGVTLVPTVAGQAVPLGNVAAGALTATSTDAVNGSQLFATNTQVAANTTAIGTNTAAIGAIDTRVTTNTTNIAGLDTRVTTNTQDITTLQGQTANAVRYDTDAAGNRTGGVTLVSTVPGQAVTIGNVAAGALSATSTDAVNGSQLFATNDRLDTTIASLAGFDTRITANTDGLAALRLSALQYDNAARDRITLAGAAGTVLANVGAGTLSATSTEAVNGSQLFATNLQVAANTSAIAQIGNGSAGPVRYSTPGAPTTPNGGTVTNDLTLVGTGTDAVALHNVAAGTLAAGSTDAVNGGQLNTTNQAVAALDNRVTAGEGRITTLETNVANNSGAITAIDARVTDNSTAITNLQNNAAGTNTTVNNLTTQVTSNTNAITNLQTQVGNQPLKYADAATPTTPNGGTLTDDATLVGAGGGAVGLHNVRAGALVAGSTDAVNGGQLAETNAQVAANTSAITTLSNVVAGSTVSAVQYSNPGSPTTPNGGIRTNDVTLVGVDAAAPVGLHNVANGVVAAGSTDAVNGGQLNTVTTQLNAVAAQSANSLQYDRDATGARTNRVTLAGGNAAAPVTIANVAAGTVAAGSMQAVNGGQLHATNQTAVAALALGANSVQYDGTGNVTFGAAGSSAPVALRNVAAGTSPTDAVNLAQLQSGMRSVLGEATTYIDSRLAAVGFDLNNMRRDMAAGSSAAMAVAALPQPMEPGATMVSIGGGTYRGQSAIAFGASRAFNDGRAVVKVGGTMDSQGYAGANAGVGFQF